MEGGNIHERNTALFVDDRPFSVSKDAVRENQGNRTEHRAAESVGLLKGKEQLKCVDAAFTEIEQTALQGFTAAEQQALCAYLLRIHKNFESKA